MCLAQGPQRSDAGEALTRGLSVSSQALYHWATALPACLVILACFLVSWGFDLSGLVWVQKLFQTLLADNKIHH